MLVDVDVRAAEGWLKYTSGALARLLGRSTASMASVVAAALG
jgi:hypothetical protein